MMNHEVQTMDYEHEDEKIQTSQKYLNSLSSKILYLPPTKSRADPGDHFEATDGVPVTISNPTLTDCKVIPDNNVAN